jgi:uncharacterized protein YgbK (DUF1537 family)
MTPSKPVVGAGSTFETLDVPPQNPAAGATGEIQEFLTANRYFTVVLDDDPTGSQAVHGIDVVLIPEAGEVVRALREGSGSCFVLTNTRSLTEGEAIELTSTLVGNILEILRDDDVVVRFISRSDSTLRGHVIAEISVLEKAQIRSSGKGFQAILFAPAFIEAARKTAGDTHWAKVSGEMRPVSETEYSKDSSFGYANSDLRDFLEEKSKGSIKSEDVASLSLDVIRLGGPDAVAEILLGVPAGSWVVVNALEYSDLEIVALGVTRAERLGGTFVFRSGPSFVKPLLGIETIPPVTKDVIWAGLPQRPDTNSRGLIMVGSHTALSTSQMDSLIANRRVNHLVVDVAQLLTNGPGRLEYVNEVAKQAIESLKENITLISTSRTVVPGADISENLDIARSVSSGMSHILRLIAAHFPAWVIGKGGITSHDLAVQGLGITRARVLGQLFPGNISVFRPLVASSDCQSIPYIVFPGNVGDENTLTRAVEILEG